MSASSRRFSFKKALVVLQFTISIGLIGCTAITYQQFSYIKQKDLGLNKEQIIAIRNVPNAVKSKYSSFKNELIQFSGIIDASASMEVPSREIRDTGPVFAEGMQEGDNPPVMDMQPVDWNFVEFMQLELVAGESLSQAGVRDVPFPKYYGYNEVFEHINGSKRVYLLNESAVDLIGWSSPQEALGKQLNWGNSAFQLQRGLVVGVVKDFHQESLRNKIDPLVLVYEPLWLHTVLIKIHPKDTEAALAFAEEKWHEVFPDYPFEYVFLDDLFEQLYQSEKMQTQILTLFSGIAILIAFFGIFGLAAYMAENRRKEVGIRKVLGASAPGIVILFSREFLAFVFAAGVIATPPAWYFMRDWLRNFAYRIDIGLEMFLFATVLALIVALITVGFQAVKTALANPIEALRYE